MNIAQYLLTKLIRGYQLTLSPLVGFHCRFAPSCSEYMKEAVIEYGAIKGVAMGIKRLARCHPWGGHGYDPVKTDSDKNQDQSSTSNHHKLSCRHQ